MDICLFLLYYILCLNSITSFERRKICILKRNETTICDPATTSHVKVSAEVRAIQGITDSLLRLSVGIENVEDLIKDIRQALEI